MMIVGLYATLGLFLWNAARRPETNVSLIWFTVWSSVVHAVIMAVQALGDPAERGRLGGDVRRSWWWRSSSPCSPARARGV